MQKRLNQFDGLRGIFTILILIDHYFTTVAKSELANVPRLWDDLYSYAYLGVEFFFMASGFFVAYTYKEKIQSHSVSSGKFLGGRIKKLYPSYLFSVLLGILIIILDNVLISGVVLAGDIKGIKVLSSVLMVQKGWAATGGNPYGSGTWFINVLLLCYILYYLVTTAFEQRQKYLGTCLFIALLGWAGISYEYNFPFYNKATQRGFLCFFLGCVLYEIYKAEFKWMKKLLVLLSIIGVITFAGCICFGSDNLLGNVDLFASLFYYPLIIMDALYFDLLSKILTLKIFTFVGSISMAIYLSHHNVYRLMMILTVYMGREIDSGRYRTFAMYIGVAFIVGILWHFLLEKKLFPYIVKKIEN